MSQDRRNAGNPQFKQNSFQTAGNLLKRKFHQQVTAGKAQSGQVAGAKISGQVRGDHNFRARQNSKRQPLFPEHPGEKFHPGDYTLPGAPVTLVQHVGSSHNRCDPVLHGLPGHGQGFPIVSRAVVQAGQDMRMQINHILLRPHRCNNSSNNSRRRREYYLSPDPKAGPARFPAKSWPGAPPPAPPNPVAPQEALRPSSGKAEPRQSPPPPADSRKERCLLFPSKNPLFSPSCLSPTSPRDWAG